MDGERHSACKYTISWQAPEGQSFTAEVLGIRLSELELGISVRQEIATGSAVHVKSVDGSVEGDCVVRECRRGGGHYFVGLEFQREEGEEPKPEEPEDENHYEVLQISDKADVESIHRVFRLMAARFHPDNPETGDLEKFVQLTRAYEVLSHPARRAEYDAERQARQNGPMKIFESKDFVVGVEAEENRRLGVLTLLYNHRRSDPDHPGVSLLDLERWMALPREYLNFTTWYLKSKQFVVMGDSCDYVLTADGVDFVEQNAGRSQILSGLLLEGRTKLPSGPQRLGGEERRLRQSSRKGLPAPAAIQ
jgi:DnaJ domain